MTENASLPSHAIDCYKVFNMLNNSGCMKVFDLRSAASFEISRIRNSVPLDMLQDMAIIRQTLIDFVEKQKGLFGLLLVFDEETNARDLDSIHNFIATETEIARRISEKELQKSKLLINWRRLEYVHTVNFFQFKEAYLACDTLFDGHENPPKPGFKGRNRYFATEIEPNFIYLGEGCTHHF
jgi:hypothetical protein